MIDKRLSVFVDGKKRCTLCCEYKELSVFSLWLDKKVNKRYYTSRCKPCMSIASRRSALKRVDDIREKNKVWRDTLRDRVYSHYGGKCNCCGENNPLFLTIDHINNDGYLDRLRDKPGGIRKPKISGHWYKHIIETGFPLTLQLLCYNCNCGKQRNKGVCPHANPASV